MEAPFGLIIYNFYYGCQIMSIIFVSFYTTVNMILKMAACKWQCSFYWIMAANLNGVLSVLQDGRIYGGIMLTLLGLDL